MKSRTKPALRVVSAAPMQLSVNVQGVLADVRHAFYGLCVDAGKQVLAAMMEADLSAPCHHQATRAQLGARRVGAAHVCLGRAA
jgi:hypothetical protein